MDMYCVSDSGEWGAGIHNVNVHMNELCALAGQDRGAQYSVCLDIGDNLDETSRLADLVSLPIIGHIKSRDLDICTRSPSLFLGHADAAKLRIDENAIRYHAIRGP